MVLRPGFPPLGPPGGRPTRAAAAGRVAGGGRRGRHREMAGQPRVVRVGVGVRVRVRARVRERARVRVRVRGRVRVGERERERVGEGGWERV